jgi:hypothetical protein
VIGLSVPAVAPAQAYMVAGWDFSQYIAAGLLTTDGTNPATTLSANYSNLDPTFAAGAESAAFGRLYYNGNFGSSNVVVDGSGFEDVVPSAGSLSSNLDAPILGAANSPVVATPAPVPFDSFDVLIDEGQQFANLLGMVAQIQGPVSLVFLADLRPTPETGTDWSVSFAGMTLAGASTVGIEYSTDGTSYAGDGEVTLTTTDSLFEVALTPTASKLLFVRFNFDPAAETFPTIDNVAIHVPEPEMATALHAAWLALLACGLRRARSRVR